MSSSEKSLPEKYITTLRNGKPFIEHNPAYKAQLRHRTRWPDRIISGLVGLAGAAVVGTVAAAASYVLPLVPVAAHAGMAALSAIASSAGVVAAAGVAALGGVLGLAAVGVAGLLALAGAVRLYDEYNIAMDTGFRPVSALVAGGVTLTAALGMAVTAAPEPQQAAVSKIASASTAFNTRPTQANTASPAVQTNQGLKKSAPALAA